MPSGSPGCLFEEQQHRLRSPAAARPAVLSELLTLYQDAWSGSGWLKPCGQSSVAVLDVAVGRA